MCTLTEKLDLFNYTIDKWVEKQAEIDRPPWMAIEKAKEIAIEKFSTTRFMKLLYFTCLESARDDNSHVNSDNLFTYFNDFRAYKNGPIEQTIYDHKEQMLTISKNEKYQYKPDKTEKDLIDRIDIDLRKMIDKSIDALTKDDGKSIPFSVDDDIEKLIWISHGELWNIAQFTKDKKLFVNESYFLEKELDVFDKRKKHLMVNYKLVASYY